METRAAVRSLIQVTFEGMVVLFVKDGAAFCDAGLLKMAPNHVASLLLTKIPKKGAPETIVHLHDAQVEERLWLDVQPADGSNPRISLYNNGAKFNRQTHADDQDFRWVLDFEGEEMYKSGVSHDASGFRSFLRMNAGKFYTQQKSENQLVLVRPTGRETIGKVAVKIRAEIELAVNDVAYFSIGSAGKPIKLGAEPDLDYGIYLSLVRHLHEDAGAHEDAGDHLAAAEDVDAENYHTALATDKPPTRKIHFDIAARATPDAACFSPSSGPPGY
ncbi:MAG TPA: hypothetical protein VGN86_06245 [Pyrinomonadaceae bacterium]|jgi:hypothetical protein|nr:hypothetical protein [Pyrinomonadaceae bacterium]